jgi:outer membrane murein-binding lipoprotein Lpp
MQELHDKGTRGIALSADEQARLEAWYAEQYAAEQALLLGGQLPSKVDELQTQVDLVLAQISVTAERIQQIAAQNEALKSEVAQLQQRLTSQAA